MAPLAPPPCFIVSLILEDLISVSYHYKLHPFCCYVQAFVSPDGGGGSNLEHSAADGIAAMQVDIYVLDMMYVIIVYYESMSVNSKHLYKAFVITIVNSSIKVFYYGILSVIVEE